MSKENFASIRVHSRLLIIVIALASFGLRVWGLDFGLPFAYHPDEQQYIRPALGVVGGDFEPLAHYNPALYPYLIGLVYAATYAGLQAFGAFPEFFSLEAAWSEAMLPWISGVVYLARFTSAASGVLTTLVVYQLGRRAYDESVGLGAALIFGLAFLPVREAHFAVSDAPVALAVAVTLYLCLGIVRRGRGVDYLAAGVALGLAAATKYNAGLLALPIGVAHLVSRRYETWAARLRAGWRVVVSGLMGLVTYALVSPYTFIELDEFWADFGENLVSARAGFSGLDLDPAGGAVFYAKGLGWGMGWPVVVLMLLGVGVALWRRRRVDWVLVVLPVLGLFYMQRQAMYFVRWLMPFIPPLAVLAAMGAQAAVQGGLRRQGEAGRRLVLVGLVLVLTLPSAVAAGRANYVFSQPDTRTEALHWIRGNIPPGSVVAVQLLSPPWSPPLALPGLNVGPYQFVPVPDGGVAEADLTRYRQAGVEYIIASSFYYARPLLDKERQARLEANMAQFEAQAELVAVFDPYGGRDPGFFYHDQVYGPGNDVFVRRQPGPIIRIYRLS